MSELTTPTDAAQAALKASTLVESLPWLKRFHNQTMVIKFGGNAMIDEDLLRAFAEDIVYLRYAGIRPVVVHGGGPQISKMLAKLGIESEFRGGYRVTSREAMGVVQMVLAGQISREIVGHINQHGPLAVAFSGDDAGLFGARKRYLEIDGETVDLGQVGDIVRVNCDGLLQRMDSGYIPVVSSIAPDIDSPRDILNVNADAAAAALAIALGAAKLVILTDVAGLYSDWPNRESLVSAIDAEELRGLLPLLESGMIPKMTACLDAVDGGVSKAAIIDGRLPHSILLEVFTQKGIGTEVTSSPSTQESSAL
jgi:acetylglutamate kinase